MNSKTAIGIQDVLLYVRGQIIDPSWRDAVEATRTTHPELWEAEIVRVALGDGCDIEEPDESEDEVPESIVRYYEKRPVFEGGTTTMPKLALVWAEFLRTIAAGYPIAQPPSEVIPSEKCVSSDDGTLLFVHTTAMLGHDLSPSVTPQDIPWLFADDVQGLLTIRQPLDRLPNGIVELVVLRRVSPNVVKLLHSTTVQLKRISQPRGRPYWGAIISLKSLIGEAKAGENLIYCVLPEAAK